MTRRRATACVVLLIPLLCSLPFAFATKAAAQASARVTIFAAVPNAANTTVTVAGLAQGPPLTTFDGGPGAGHLPVIQIQETAFGCGDNEFVTSINLNTLTTDGSGNAYFEQVVPFGIPLSTQPDHVTAVSTAPSTASYDGNCYPIGPDNTSWVTASDLSAAGSESDEIALPGESRWYKIKVETDSQVTVSLSGPSCECSNTLPESLNVAAFSDIGQAYTTLGGTQSLTKLSAEFAADTFTPSAFTPSAFTPSAFTPSAFTPSAFTPSAFTPSAFTPSAFTPSAFTPSEYSPSAFTPSAATPSAFTPSAFTPSAFTPSAFTPSAFTPSVLIPSLFNPQTYASAQTRSLIETNLQLGTAPKSLTVNTWQNTGYFYFSVGGAGGAASPGSPFVISVNLGGSPCATTIGPFGSPPAAAANNGYKTVILTDSSRIGGTVADRADLTTELQQLAARPEVKGVIVDLSQNSRVTQLNGQADANDACPYAKNLVAESIADVVNSYRAANPIAYVVIAGADNVIPFFRYPDPTLLGNETGYYPPVADSSASQASLRNGYILSDDGYGSTNSIALNGSAFPVPDLPAGRLVETPNEISGVIQAYLATSGGVVATPQSSLVTGYDFMTPAANDVESNLVAGMGTASGTTHQTLIEPQADSPQSPLAWTGTDLRNAVLNSGRHDIVFLAGHFSANDALAADYTTDMLTTDMEQSSVNLENSIVFSAGCHSGYNIVNGDAIPDVTIPLDWPEEFARKQATLIAGSGYQYGDTDFVAYSEKLYVGFSHQLLVGTGPVAVGSALLAAKQNYLNATPSLGTIDRKALLEATLYGLPMLSINMPDGRITAPSDPSIVTSTTAATVNPGSTLGLRSASVTVTPTLTTNTQNVTNVNDASTVTATYLSGGNGVATNPYAPVLPLEVRNVSVPGEVLRGTAFRGGTFTDTAGITPLTDAPATDIRGVHTDFSSSTFFPERLWNANYFGALAGGSGATHLTVTPAQYVSDPGGASTDTQRAFSSMSFQLFYSNNTTTYSPGTSTQSTPAQAAAPDITGVTAQVDATDPGLVDVCASVVGDPTAGVQDAFVTWSDASQASGSWQSVDLKQNACTGADHLGNPLPTDSLHWGGSIPLGSTMAQDLRFMVQAVNGVGLVSMDDNDGAFYSLTPQVRGTSAFCGVTVSSLQAASGSSIAVSDQLVNETYCSAAANPSPIVGATVTFALGSATVSAVTDSNGVATASLPVVDPVGGYTLTASFSGSDTYYPATDQVTPFIAVTPQPTALVLTMLSPTNGAETSFTAQVCASSTGCSASDPQLTQRTVVFELAGPATRTVSAITDGTGEVQFNEFGLPAGSYTLNAYFDGSIPNVGTFNDPVYAPSSATATFSTAGVSNDQPTLIVPASPPTAPATGPNGAVVRYTVSATDPIDPRPSVSCSPGNDTLFAIGSTTVTCTATNTAGNSVTKSFTVTVHSLAKQLSPGTTVCNGVYFGTGSSITVPAGAVCTLLAGTRIGNTITVQSGGVLHATGISVGHNVTLQGAGGSTICSTSIGNNLSVVASATRSLPIVIGDTATGCSAGNIVGNNLSVTGNAGPVDVGDNTVGNNLTVQNNTPGGATVVANKAGNNALCSGNVPQAGSRNTAKNTNTCPK